MTQSLLCAACKSPVPVDATRCAHCTSNLSPAVAKARGSMALLVMGLILCCTVVGAVIGVPMIVMAMFGKVEAKPLTVSA